RGSCRPPPARRPPALPGGSRGRAGRGCRARCRWPWTPGRGVRRRGRTPGRLLLGVCRLHRARGRVYPNYNIPSGSGRRADARPPGGGGGRTTMADTISISCPDCKKQMKAPAHLEGKKVRCKECGATFAVKAPAPARAAPEPKPAPAKDKVKPAKGGGKPAAPAKA